MSDTRPVEPSTPLLRPRRLGVLAHGFADWGGGIDFLRIIVSSLHHAAPDVEVHVLAPLQGPRVWLRALRDWVRARLGKASMAAHRPTLVDLQRALADTGCLLHLIDLGPAALERQARRLGLDALVPAIAPVPSGGLPWVGYVFDFQHRHLPQFFTEQERSRRDAEFGRMLDQARVVVVNARDVIQDADRFFPNRRAVLRAMPFSPAPSAGAFSADVDEVCRRYGVRGPYFIICNQFWRHKDHATAFRAFVEVARSCSELSLVCTGATSDYRFPGHVDQLMAQVRQDGVADRVHLLGLIPKQDQLALIRGAVALVQPTLFEGGPGGGAVYDAVALGQRAIVSDIAVNTEITDPEVTFFPTGDAEALARVMLQVWHEHGDRPPPPDAATLIARGVQRRRACGDVLLAAVSEAMRMHARLDPRSR